MARVNEGTQVSGTETMNGLIGKRLESWVYSDEKLVLYFEGGTALEVHIDDPEMVAVSIRMMQVTPLYYTRK